MTEIKEKPNYGLNRGNLKMIALFCMALDHFATIVLGSWIEKMNTESLSYVGIMVLMILLGLIGRLAFPIFCFFIVEGMSHTRNVFLYASRLLILAVISEVPFDMAHSHCIFDMEGQNVFWTLLIGLIAIYCMDGIFKKFRCKKAFKYIAITTIYMLTAIIELYFNSDYGTYGVLTIVIIYLIGRGEYLFSIILSALSIIADFIFTRDFSVAFIILLITAVIVASVLLYLSRIIINNNSKKMFAACAILTAMSIFELSAFADVFLMQFYNGQKGKKIGWLFYLFYPAHLAALAGICKLVGLY